MKSPKDGGGWFGCLVRLGGMFISPTMFSWYFCNIQWWLLQGRTHQLCQASCCCYAMPFRKSLRVDFTCRHSRQSRLQIDYELDFSKFPWPSCNHDSLCAKTWSEMFFLVREQAVVRHFKGQLQISRVSIWPLAQGNCPWLFFLSPRGCTKIAMWRVSQFGCENVFICLVHFKSI